MCSRRPWWHLAPIFGLALDGDADRLIVVDEQG
jgi:phosphomannomutase